MKKKRPKKGFRVEMDLSTFTTDMTAQDLKDMVMEALNAPAHGYSGIGRLVDKIKVTVTKPVPGWMGDK